MKKLFTFVAIIFFLFCLPLSATSAEEAQNPFGINPDDLILEVIPFAPSELGDGQYNGQLSYDLTQCTEDPFNASSIYSWICSCTQWNLYIDTSGFSSAITVAPVYAFSVDGQNWLTFPFEPMQLDPGYVWVIALQFPTLSGVQGQFYYAAAVEYQGQLYYNFVPYLVTINCP